MSTGPKKNNVEIVYFKYSALHNRTVTCNDLYNVYGHMTKIGRYCGEQRKLGEIHNSLYIAANSTIAILTTSYCSLSYCTYRCFLSLYDYDSSICGSSLVDRHPSTFVLDGRTCSIIAHRTRSGHNPIPNHK